MTTIVSFIVVLGVLIFIHELGHFAIAKLSGVGVEKFSLGFGPRIIGFKRGETEYLVSLLPLGGYVKMLGEHPGEEVEEREASRSFGAKPVHTRAMIVAAGPVMNLILAALLLPLIFMIGIQVPAYLEKPAVVGYVTPDEAAQEAGIKKGDIITSVDGSAIRNWEDLLSTLAMNPGKAMRVKAKRGDSSFETALTPEASEETGAGYAGMFPPMAPVIGELSNGYPAKEAGLEPGDEITAVDGKPVTHWAELENVIHRGGGEKKFQVKRGARTLTVKLIPRFNKEMNVHLIGVSRKIEQVTRRYAFFESVVRGAEASVEMTARLFMVIKGLILGKYSLKTLGGPIMIAQVAGKAAEAGFVDLLSLVAFLSLQLGIINLFPVPVLDGGHIIFLGVEFIKGRPLSERFMGVAQQIGIALLVALMLLVTYNDIFRILGRM